MLATGPTLKELPINVQPSFRRRSEMGLSIIIAVFLMIIAVSCAIAELYYNNVDLTARIALGFGSILASLLGATLVSFSTIKEQVRLEEQDQIGRVVAIDRLIAALRRRLRGVARHVRIDLGHFVLLSVCRQNGGRAGRFQSASVSERPPALPGRQ